MGKKIYVLFVADIFILSLKKCVFFLCVFFFNDVCQFSTAITRRTNLIDIFRVV